jgi:hypothetical protein
MRHEARHEHDGERPFANDLIGEVQARSAIGKTASSASVCGSGVTPSSTASRRAAGRSRLARAQPHRGHHTAVFRGRWDDRTQRQFSRVWRRVRLSTA